MIKIYPHFKAQPVDSDLNHEDSDSNPDDSDLDSDLVDSTTSLVKSRVTNLPQVGHVRSRGYAHMSL